MSKKRPNESEEERKARKIAKKEKKAKKSKKLVKQEKVDLPDKSTADTPVKQKKEAETKAEFTSFTDAPFAKPVQQALTDAGFTEPSPIQARAWPVVLEGKDLIAVAKTGSGKTLGFLLPIFHHIATDKTPAPLCLVLAPTRELAIQIHSECVKFGPDIVSACVYGGTNVKEQIDNLKKNKPQVVIATPGRLCDILERKALDLSKSCRYCVLDEADRMLDMGFEPQLKKIMAALPKERQTLFFTATWPTAVRRAAARFLRDGQTVEVFVGDSSGELEANKAVTQTFIEAQDDEKDKKLYELLCSLDEKASVVVFANTERRVDFISSTFWNEGFTTCAVHGDKPQRERDAALLKFINKECAIMVATDVAARGLDIKGVTHVVNFDMARDVESYVHRIGRTGRAGELGEAVTFWNPDYDKDCSPALVKIAKDAGQIVPPFLQKYEKSKSSKQWKVADAEKAAAVLRGEA
jgi:superfamily II DNA/RNA helicase